MLLTAVAILLKVLWVASRVVVRRGHVVVSREIAVGHRAQDGRNFLNFRLLIGRDLGVAWAMVAVDVPASAR